jgi:hypothetical protein
MKQVIIPNILTGKKRNILKDFSIIEQPLDRKKAEEVYEQLINSSSSIIVMLGHAGSGKSMVLHSLSTHLRNNAKELGIQKDIISYDLFSSELAKEKKNVGVIGRPLTDFNILLPCNSNEAGSLNVQISKNVLFSTENEAFFNLDVNTKALEFCSQHSLRSETVISIVLESLLQDDEFTSVVIRKFQAYRKAQKQEYTKIRHGAVLEKLYKNTSLHFCILYEYIDLTHNIRKEIESITSLLDSITWSFSAKYSFHNAKKQPRRTSSMLKAA